MIAACVHCGSTELRVGDRRATLLEGGLDAVESVCRECGGHGVPRRFQNDADWWAFRRQRIVPPAAVKRSGPARI